MKPKPWSPSALEAFVNCPRAYHETKVTKAVKDVQGAEALWGINVHAAFEQRLLVGTPLPVDMRQYESFLASVEALPGIPMIESKVALNRRLQPCGYWDKDVWMRSVLDYGKVNGAEARVWDWKTGKPHSKFAQLKLYALWVFARYPNVLTVATDYFWTKTGTPTGQTYARHQIGELWDEFVPDLRQYVEAFKTDTWQPRQSGLCGWCPVTACEHWRPRR